MRSCEHPVIPTEGQNRRAVHPAVGRLTKRPRHVWVSQVPEHRSALPGGEQPRTILTESHARTVFATAPKYRDQRRTGLQRREQRAAGLQIVLGVIRLDSEEQRKVCSVSPAKRLRGEQARQSDLRLPAGLIARVDETNPGDNGNNHQGDDKRANRHDQQVAATPGSRLPLFAPIKQRAPLRALYRNVPLVRQSLCFCQPYSLQQVVIRLRVLAPLFHGKPEALASLQTEPLCLDGLPKPVPVVQQRLMDEIDYFDLAVADRLETGAEQSRVNELINEAGTLGVAVHNIRLRNRPTDVSVRVAVKRHGDEVQQQSHQRLSLGFRALASIARTSPGIDCLSLGFESVSKRVVPIQGQSAAAPDTLLSNL